PAKFVFDTDDRRGHAVDSMVCAGVVLSGATARRAVLSPGVHLHSYAEVEESVLMQGVDVGRGAVVRRAILDKNVRVAPGAQAGDAPHLAALRAMSIDLSMAAGVEGAALVHSHTWYANLGGHLAKLVYGIPHVATVHSLEPLRPWKAEQLGGGYALSGWCEQV